MERFNSMEDGSRSESERLQCEVQRSRSPHGNQEQEAGSWEGRVSFPGQTQLPATTDQVSLPNSCQSWVHQWISTVSLTELRSKMPLVSTGGCGEHTRSKPEPRLDPPIRLLFCFPPDLKIILCSTCYKWLSTCITNCVFFPTLSWILSRVLSGFFASLATTLYCIYTDLLCFISEVWINLIMHGLS